MHSRACRFRPNQPTVFAWLGVTMYLTQSAIEGAWQTMRSVAAQGSELVFDFLHPDALSETAPSPRQAGVPSVGVQHAHVREIVFDDEFPSQLDCLIASFDPHHLAG